VGETIAKLMARLRYDRYGAQGGDWGAIATTQLGLVDAEHLAGIHLNMVIAGPPAGVDNPMEGVSPEEMQGMGDMGDFQKNETGYQQIQGTKPQTLGYALHDSPVGQLAWITEKFRTWTDCDGVIENAVSRDELLTNVTLYWLTGTAGSSARLYRETQADQRDLKHYLETPTGLACFPGELVTAPRSWLEPRVNLVHYEQMPRGGHFAALEVPELLVADVRAFFRERR
jgi:pimeloyl-ACP methyl ester carboxylesterase